MEKHLAFNITAYQIENSNLAQTAAFDKNGNINGDTNIKEMTGATRSRIELDVTEILHQIFNQCWLCIYIIYIYNNMNWFYGYTDSEGSS